MAWSLELSEKKTLYLIVVWLLLDRCEETVLRQDPVSMRDKIS